MSDSSDFMDAAATGAELASASFEATDASFASWGDSIQADSNATAAYYAGDDAGVQYWNGVSDAAETDSHAYDSAAGDLWSDAVTAPTEDPAADTEPVYDAGAEYTDGGYDAGYVDPTYDPGYVDTTVDAGYVDPGYVDTSGGYDATAGFDASGGGIDTGYDPSSSWAATDTVTDYYTDADW